MFNSHILDIGIGLVITYLFLGLVVTALNELMATLTRARSIDLERGIRNFLDGKSSVPERWWQWIGRRFRGDKKPEPGGWSQEFFRHQLINGLSKDNQKPSYVPSQTFAMVLLQLVHRSAKSEKKLDPHAAPPPGDPLPGGMQFDDLRATIEKINNPVVKDALLPLLEEARSGAENSLAAVKRLSDQVEIWYEHAMDRVSGWYKSRAQCILFGIAVLLVACLNVDTIEMSRRLGKDEALLAALVETAKAYKPSEAKQIASQPEELEARVDDVQHAVSRVQGLGIPLGWNKWPTTFEETFYKIIGLFLTALAVSLGAPFWFDILSKFMAVRSTGKAPEEKPRSPKEVLQPPAPKETP